MSTNRSNEADHYILTRDGSQVEIVSDHLLEFMVYGALLELKAQVVTQIFVDDFSLKTNKQKYLLSTLSRKTKCQRWCFAAGSSAKKRKQQQGLGCLKLNNLNGKHTAKA